MGKYHFFPLLLALLLGSACGKAQAQRFSLADTLLRYGPVQTVLLHDGVNRWLMEREQTVGYEQCYREYYDSLCLAVSKAWEQRPEDAPELEISRLCIAWQQGELTIDSAVVRIQQIYDTDTQQHGNTTFEHINQTCLMAAFFCAAGRFAEAEACYQHVKKLKDAGTNVYSFQYCVLLEALMVAQAGQGRLTDAWSTALTIVGRNNVEVRREYESQFNGFIPYERNLKGSVELKADGYGLGLIKLSAAAIDKARRLAQQLLLSVLLPSPSAFRQSDIVPWPLCLSSALTTPRSRSLFAVFALQELIFYLDFPTSFCNSVAKGIEEMGQQLFDEWGGNFVAPPLAVDICRRSAMMAARQDTTIHYLHDKKATIAMVRWMHCMVVEQQNNYERSALVLIGYISEWIKKGYPLSMLPLAEEAVQAMRRELDVQHPTQHQLILRAQDQRWLIHELPQWSTLVSNIPEYAPIVAALRSLTKS